MIARINHEPIEILVAEDESTDILFVQRAFKHTNYRANLNIVPNGEELMAYLRKEKDYKDKPTPDLILMDINMPRKNGHEALQEIKHDEVLKSIPVIMLSGSNANADIMKSYQNYANAYMPKSANFDEMETFVKAIEDFWMARVHLPHVTSG
ncbi:MAG: response regulator [Rhodospirillales bacterium]|nr:response regulator [Rhodospirillales bacterium]MCB9964612.1 response regulator [Rhodospirillales bacterium]MCB9979901.1 response regulator [Rhodospirillales bacterium]